MPPPKLASASVSWDAVDREGRQTRGFALGPTTDV